jgi:hypothetical protein
MKKFLLILALFTCVLPSFAQSGSKNNLPEAGDYSIGFNAVPLIDFALDKTRIFSDAPASSSAGIISYQQPLTLSGKYMKDVNTAYRATLMLGYERTTNKTFVPKIGGDIGEDVTDTEISSNFGLKVSLGKQFYRGDKNLRGFYGYEGLIGVSREDIVKKKYGNELDTINSGNRVIKSSQGRSIGIGARGFVGLEYFFAAKLSVSAEFGYGLNYQFNAGASSVAEEFKNGQAEETEIKMAGSQEFNMNADNADGRIVFSFYF